MDLYGSSDEHWGSQLQREKYSENKDRQPQVKVHVQVYIHVNFDNIQWWKISLGIELEVYHMLMFKLKNIHFWVVKCQVMFYNCQEFSFDRFSRVFF